jgi:hypothetical protein
MAKIRLVAGDTGPQLKLTITEDPSGLAVDLTNATGRFILRATGTTTVLLTKTLTINSGPGGDAPQGVCYVTWSAGDLNLAAGDYEGEVEITMPSGMIQTVFEPLQIRLRADFD